MLTYAPAALKDDHEIVLEAVKQDGCALKYASAELREDLEQEQDLGIFTIFTDPDDDDY